MRGRLWSQKNESKGLRRFVFFQLKWVHGVKNHWKSWKIASEDREPFAWVGSRFGRVLVAFWSRFGRVLVAFWLRFGRVLVAFWSRSGRVLVVLWSCAVCVLVDFWLRFDRAILSVRRSVFGDRRPVKFVDFRTLALRDHATTLFFRTFSRRGLKHHAATLFF